jgi:hypothetical protein
MFVKKLLGLLAVGGLLVVAAPTPQAQAASPLTPGVTTAIQQGSAGVVTDVQYRRHHRHYHQRRHYHPRHHYVPRVYVPRHHYHRHHHHHRRW